MKLVMPHTGFEALEEECNDALQALIKHRHGKDCPPETMEAAQRLAADPIDCAFVGTIRCVGRRLHEIGAERAPGVAELLMLAFRNCMCIRAPKERDKRRAIIELAWIGFGDFEQALERRQGDPMPTHVNPAALVPQK